LTGPGHQERDELVEQGQLVRRDPQEPAPVRFDPVAARREARRPAHLVQPRRQVRGHEPERLLTQPRRVLLLEPLQLSRLPPQQGSFGRPSIEVIAGQLQLEHHLVVGLRLRPRRGQLRQQVRPTDHEEAIALHLLQPDLGRILPPGRTAGDALRLLGERPLRELLRVPHYVADSTPRSRASRCDRRANRHRGWRCVVRALSAE
jgi:hypothetical protein